MKTILCVEDEPNVLENNRKALADSGYIVLSAASLAEARIHLAGRKPDAVVLDIMLPDGLGLDLLSELRGAGDKIPVLLLTAWDKPYDIARGLKLGANDYISKPFDYEVLLARVEAMFRNAEQLPDRIERDAISLDLLSSRAFVNGADLLLTQKEFALLLLFVQNENRLIDAEYLYEKVWNAPMGEDSQALKTSVSRLRAKLIGSGYTIAYERDAGYRFHRK